LKISDDAFCDSGGDEILLVPQDIMLSTAGRAFTGFDQYERRVLRECKARKPMMAQQVVVF